MKLGVRSAEWGVCISTLAAKLTMLFGLLTTVLTALAGQPPPSPVRFGVVDVYVDSQDQSLAAYQLEFKASRGLAKIVGIEGGETAPFNLPPFYDPEAMQHERVVIAAYGTGLQRPPPKGRTRVASIHLEMIVGQTPEFAVKLTTAGNAGGRRIKATATLEERNTK